MEKFTSGSEFYESDKERWDEINRVKKKVAQHLRVPPGLRVLDILVGEGDFTRAFAKSSEGTCVIAGEILAPDLKEAKGRIERDKLKDRVELLRIDVTHIAFINNSFDYVVNFSGWEDFTAISGEELIDQLFREIVRVLKMNGILAVTFIPSLEPKDYVSRKDKELEEYMYMSCRRRTFFHESFFLQMFEEHGIKLLEKNSFETPRSRLRPKDGKRFLEWCCRNYKSFFADVKMRPYGYILREFGEFIEEYGVRERRSRFTLLKGRRVV